MLFVRTAIESSMGCSKGILFPSLICRTALVAAPRLKAGYVISVHALISNHISRALTSFFPEATDRSATVHDREKPQLSRPNDSWAWAAKVKSHNTPRQMEALASALRTRKKSAQNRWRLEFDLSVL